MVIHCALRCEIPARQTGTNPQYGRIVFLYSATE
jgi:hypothetical protein